MNSLEVKEDVPKNRRTAAILALFFGFIGAHCFYLGNKKAGLIRVTVCFALSILGSLMHSNFPIALCLIASQVECIRMLLKDNDQFAEAYTKYLQQGKVFIW